MFTYSVVIPVYNAERYIAECLNSLVSQKAKLEIIVVDDGSTDNSGKICDEFASRYNYIKVIHIENSGPGNARNVGAAMASGDFLMFVDADDYISEDFFEKFEKSDSDFEADIIFFELIKVFENQEVNMAQGLKKENLYKKSKKDVYCHMSEISKFPASPCGKIINLKFYNASQIKMMCGVICEDVDWSLALILKASSFDFFNDGFYYYRRMADSRSSFGNEKTVKDALFIVEKWIDALKNNEYKEYFLCFMAYQYAMIFPFVGALKGHKRREYAKKMKTLKYILEYGKTRKLRAIKLAVKFLGVNLASRLLYLYVCMNERGKLK